MVRLSEQLVPSFIECAMVITDFRPIILIGSINKVFASRLLPVSSVIFLNNGFLLAITFKTSVIDSSKF